MRKLLLLATLFASVAFGQNLKISAMPVVPLPYTGNELIPVEIGGVNYQMSITDLIGTLTNIALVNVNAGEPNFIDLTHAINTPTGAPASCLAYQVWANPTNAPAVLQCSSTLTVLSIAMPSGGSISYLGVNLPLAALTAAANNTFLTNQSGGSGPMGAGTSFGCSFMPALFVDISLNLSTCAVTVGQASGNFNVFGALSAATIVGGIFTAPIETAGTAVTVASGTGNCAATGTVNGGVQGGDFTCTTSQAAQASTVTLTLPATARAYICNNNRDVTNPTTITQTGALSTTSVTLSLASVTTGDVIQFGCPTAY